MKAIIYAAKSTVDEHDSLPQQVRDCRALAEANGLEVAGEFRDEAASGYHGNRGPGLADAMALAEEVAPCVLIVQHSSRLGRGDGRTAKHLVEYAVWAGQRDVRLMSVEDPHTFTDDESGIGMVMAALAGMGNHQFSRRLSTSIKKGQLRSFTERGNWHGRVPDGYWISHESGQREIVKDEVAAPTIERMFRLGVEQHLPPSAIARSLNRDGLLNPRGASWRSRDVKRVLTNPFYAGIMSYGGETRDGSHETYVSREDHEQLVLRYGRTTPRSEGPVVKGRRANHHILAGLAVCGRCGAKMYSDTRTRRRADGSQQREYVCAEYRGRTGVCSAHVDADVVDQHVLRWLDHFVSDFDEWRREVFEAAISEREEAQRALDHALSEIDRLDGRAGKLERDYLRALDRGEDSTAERVLRLAQRNDEERQQAMMDVEACRDALAKLDDERLVERMQETAKRLSERDVALVNDALKVEFEAFVIDVDAETVTPIGKPSETKFDLLAAYQRYLAESGDNVQNAQP